MGSTQQQLENLEFMGSTQQQLENLEHSSGGVEGHCEREDRGGEDGQGGGDIESEERPGEAGEEEQGAEGENQGKAWSDAGTRRRQPGRRGRERIKSKAEISQKGH